MREGVLFGLVMTAALGIMFTGLYFTIKDDIKRAEIKCEILSRDIRSYDVDTQVWHRMHCKQVER